MNYIKYLATGILLGIVLVKSEAVSWYRIFEMFRFESFHMYGIIGSAVLTGVLLVQLSRRLKLKNINDIPLELTPKNRYLFGGIIFGLGWALTGACPGPIFTLIGTGLLSMIIVLAADVAGTFTYGIFKNKLPH